MPHRYRSVIVSQRLLGVLLFGLLLVAVPCSAVAQDDSSNSEDEDGGPSSVSVGNLSSNFTFGGSGAYNYEGNARALTISGPKGSLLLDYASSLSSGQFDRDTRRTIGAETLFGGNAHLFRDLLRLPLSIYIPIRINLDYRYTQPRNPELSNLHRGAAGLGAGGGLDFSFPSALILSRTTCSSAGLLFSFRPSRRCWAAAMRDLHVTWSRAIHRSKSHGRDCGGRSTSIWRRSSRDSSVRIPA